MNLESPWPTTRVTLLAQLRDLSNDAAWRSFVELYSPLILRYCRRRGLGEADARDVMQEVMLRSCRAIRSFDYDAARGRFRGWLGLITRQQLSRFVSKSNRARRAAGGESDASPRDEFGGQVDAAWIDEFNAHIYRQARDSVRIEFDAATWLVFEATWERDERPAEVARAIRRSSEWVYQAKFRVLQRLKAEIIRMSDDIELFARR